MATLLSPALAALPIAFILMLMLWRRFSATRAGLCGLVAAIAITAFHFGAPTTNTALPAGAVLAAGVAAEALFLAASIVWILLPALALHHRQEQLGAIALLRRRLLSLAPDPSMQLLLIAWFAALFFEGAAGFGTPVALCAPLLVGLGVPAVAAVTSALLGHAVGVSFGAIGTPLMAQAALTTTPVAEIALRTALLHAALSGVLMVALVRTLRRAGVALAWPQAALATVCFVVPSVILAAVGSPELITLGAAVAGAAAFVVLGKRAWPGTANGAAADAVVDVDAPALSVVQAVLPYATLVVLVLVTRLVGPVGEALAQVWSFRFDGRFHAALKPALHPGTLLMAALWLSALTGKKGSTRDVAAALGVAARRLAPAATALATMLALSRLMVHAGMVDALQMAATTTLGRAFVVVSPLIGALGSFVTGSATASNVLFTALQAQTAAAIGVAGAWLVAGQGVGAAIGNIICPHNVIAGVATVGLAGKEALVLRQTVAPCLVYAALAGALLAIVVL